MKYGGIIHETSNINEARLDRNEGKMRKTVFILTTVALFICCFTIHCMAEGVPEKPEFGDASIVFQDLRGKTVTLSAPATRVVVTFNFEEVLAVAGGDNPFEKIIGWSRGYWKGRRQSKWTAYTDRFPCVAEIPDVGYVSKGTLDIEKIIALNPDIVISYVNEPKTDSENYTRLEAAGIPVACVDFHSQTLENHLKSIEMLGKIFDKQDRAQEIGDFYAAEVDKVFSRLSSISGDKPRVYVEFGGKNPYQNSYGSGFMWGGIVEACRGDNISAEALGHTNGPIDPEYFFARNPEIIIITGRVSGPEPNGELRLGFNISETEARTILGDIAERTGWESISARNSGRIYGIYHANSRHIYDFYAFQCFAKWFYPDTFSDLDPEKNLKVFYDRYMPLKLDGDNTFAVSLNDQ